MTKQPMDHLRGKKQPVKKAVWIAGDSILADELSELEASLSKEENALNLMREDSPRREAALRSVEELRKKTEEARIAARDSSIKFVFQALSSKRYDRLLAEHPPTDKQIADFKKDGETVPFNPETFPLALIVESCVEPEAEPEELMEWLSGDDWNNAEIMTLFMTATEVNSTRRIVNLGKG